MPAGPGEDHDAHVTIRLGMPELLRHTQGTAVACLSTAEGDSHHPVRQTVADLLVSDLLVVALHTSNVIDR